MIDTQVLTNFALATVAGVIFFCVILLLKDKRNRWPAYIGALVVASFLDWSPVIFRNMDVTGEMRPVVALHAGVTIFSYIVLVIAVARTLTREKPYDRYFLPIWTVAYLLGFVVLFTR